MSFAGLSDGGFEVGNLGLDSCVGWDSPQVGGQTWELAPGEPATAGGQILRQTAADGLGMCLAAPLAPSSTVCNVTVGAMLEACDCGTQANCGYHRHCPKAMEFLVTTSENGSSSSVGGGGSMKIASSLDPTLCLTAGSQPHAAVNITLQIWAKPLASGDVAALALNRGAFATQAKFEWSTLRLPGGDSSVWSVRDVWQKQSLGSFANGFEATVEPHDVVMVVLKPERGGAVE